MTKVFCQDCMFFNACKRSSSRSQYDDNLQDICTAPQNINPTYVSDGSNKFVSTPNIINRFNSCTWFVSKYLKKEDTILTSKLIMPDSADPTKTYQVVIKNGQINITLLNPTNVTT